MRSEVRQVRDQLRHALGLQEGPVDTGTVLTTPNTLVKAQAVRVARSCALRSVLRDLGAVVAREMGSELSASGLRPADFADHPEVAKVLKERVLKAVKVVEKVHL